MEQVKTDGAAILDEVLAIGKRMIEEMKRYPQEEDLETDLYNRTLHFLFCKGFKTLQAIRTLCREGFLEDAQVLARTIFEIEIQAEWMEKDPRPRARAFVEHSEVSLYDFYRTLQAYEDAHPGEKVKDIRNAKRIEDLKANYERYKSPFLISSREGTVERIHKHWWKAGVSKLAREAGREGELVSVYWVQSDFVHTGSTSMRDYVKSGSEANSWNVNCFPDPRVNYLHMAVLSTRWFLRIAACLAKAWNLRLDDSTQAILTKIREQMSANASAENKDQQAKDRGRLDG